MSRVEEPPAWLHPRPVRLRQLPLPDAEQIDMHEAQICLLVGPRDPLTMRVADRLYGLGIAPVFLEVLWSGAPPGADRTEGQDVGEGVMLGRRQELPSYLIRADEDPRQIVQRIREFHGAIRGLIYLQLDVPLAQEDSSPIYPDASRLLRIPFLLARAIQPYFDEIGESGPGKLWFVTVIRQDGLLGLSGGDDCVPALGGIGGITKSLRAEWPDVFCRSVDLAGEMDPDQAAAAVVAELLDPNRMFVEVGYGPQGRVTLETVGGMPWPAM